MMAVSITKVLWTSVEFGTRFRGTSCAFPSTSRAHSQVMSAREYSRWDYTVDRISGPSRVVSPTPPSLFLSVFWQFSSGLWSLRWPLIRDLTGKAMAQMRNGAEHFSGTWGILVLTISPWCQLCAQFVFQSCMLLQLLHSYEVVFLMCHINMAHDFKPQMAISLHFTVPVPGSLRGKLYFKCVVLFHDAVLFLFYMLILVISSWNYRGSSGNNDIYELNLCNDDNVLWNPFQIKVTCCGIETRPQNHMASW